MITCNSGGALGADSIFAEECLKYSINVNAFSYKTPYHKSNDKVEISEEDYLEGIIEIKKPNTIHGVFFILSNFRNTNSIKQ